MIAIGNFFFKYRNFLFIFLYLTLFLPSPDIFTPEKFGSNYYLWPIILGLVITITGQIIRGLTIGLAYIVRGGKDKKVYAEHLVTEGIFNHCRNPLYVGNILMLLGVGILSNSLIFLCILMPLFLFIYQAIVLAEENFLRGKFGQQFDAYCSRVNRWFINLKGIGKTFASMRFNARRWILKEYNTQFVWLTGIVLLLLKNYPDVISTDTDFRNVVVAGILISLVVIYLFVRYLKKSGRMREGVV
jgi:protein-S-isoprenylcysteine O-methyltransferase Ste14